MQVNYLSDSQILTTALQQASPITQPGHGINLPQSTVPFTLQKKKNGAIQHQVLEDSDNHQQDCR